MEQRRFCARCKAPAVKGASFCVVCGGNDFVDPQFTEAVKPVEIDEAVVSAPSGSRFVPMPDATVNTVAPTNANYETQDVYSYDDPTASVISGAVASSEQGAVAEVNDEKPNQSANITSDPQTATRTVPPVRQYCAPEQERTVVYKSFEEYERELAEKNEGNDTEETEKKGGAVRVLKAIGKVLLSVFLSVVLLAGGFVLGVYVTSEGMLDEYLGTERKQDEKLIAQRDDCYDIQKDLASEIADYISYNDIYVDRETTITIEWGKEPEYKVDGDCITETECKHIFDDDQVCPSEGTYTISIVPYVDSNGVSMFRVEVSCDGGEAGYEHY